MRWNSEAEQAIKRVPIFVRKMVRRKVEEHARKMGADDVTILHVKEAKRRFLFQMEDEVRGFRVDACFGQTGCPKSVIEESDQVILRIEEILKKRGLKDFLRSRVKGPLKFHHEFHVSISCCPNACSKPQIVDFGIIGVSKPVIAEELCTECGKCMDICQEDALENKGGMPEIIESRCLMCGECIRQCPEGAIIEIQRGFRILLGGKLGRHPRLATQLPAIFNFEQVLIILEKTLELFQEHCKQGERLGAIMERVGQDIFLKEVMKSLEFDIGQ